MLIRLQPEIPEGNYYDGRPDWLSWDYAHYSTPNGFDGTLDGWSTCLDWILSATHLNTNSEGNFSFYAFAAWILGAGLMFRDLIEHWRRRETCIDSAERLARWTQDNIHTFWRLVEATTKHLTEDEPPEDPQEAPSERYTAVLMTPEELEEGIITPPLCDVAPAKAVSHSSYLKRLLVRPALVELSEDLTRYKVQS